MEFTYRAYGSMLDTLQQCGYQVADYYDNKEFKKCVILRHDVDMSPQKALTMAEFEHLHGVKSTYFVLLSTKFYNAAEKETRGIIREIHHNGHDIGLHFDEDSLDQDADVKKAIIQEAGILADLLKIPIRAVSMHRPSKTTLEANYRFNGLVNSYGEEFFHEFKYVSDSRRRWRENVEEIIRCGGFSKLHILTHPFWYNEADVSMEESLRGFILSAVKDRYDAVFDNITDFGSVLTLDQIVKGDGA